MNIVILAAGQGKRMHSNLPKVLHPIAGKALVSHVIDTARSLRPELPIRATEIAPVPTSAFPTPAQRPLNSRLDSSLLQQRFSLQLPDWQQGVTRMLHEIL